jgi:hypothetical protein
LKKKRGRGIYSPFQFRPLGAEFSDQRGAEYLPPEISGQNPIKYPPHVLAANHFFIDKNGGPDYPARIFEISGQ